MKRFPLEPLRRIRDLRLDEARRVVAERREEVEQALRRRDGAAKALGDATDRRARHQRDCALAAQAQTPVVTWLRRADRHRGLIDADIARCEVLLRGMDDELARARAAFEQAFAAYRHAQAKVDALETFRGEWSRRQRSEEDRREEHAGEELFLAVGMKR